MDAGLYIHVPFCTSVCPYCDFAVTIAGEERRRAFLDALEIEIRGAVRHGLRFDTVYLGGGTPSSLAPIQLGRILRAVDSELELAPAAVRHLEINPEDVSPETVTAWRGLGVGFASLGVQSFDDEALAFLGRRHSAEGARRAIRDLLEAGFETVSIDLIFGLPGQSAETWRCQLETALELGAHHLSCYQLTVHQKTVFGGRRHRGELVELDERMQAELYLLTHEILGSAGWRGYEVSNFASAPENRSRHNQKYWNHTPYLGLGPSAHSFVDGTRWWKIRKLRLWTSALASGRSAVEGTEVLTAEQLFLEEVMLGLRTADGVDVAQLGRAYGDVARLDEAAIEDLVASGHVTRRGDHIRPTPVGMAVADSLVRAVTNERRRPPVR